jgi:hypothetical protein
MAPPRLEFSEREWARLAMAWRLACVRLSAGALRLDPALLPGRGSVLP